MTTEATPITDSAEIIPAEAPGALSTTDLKGLMSQAISSGGTESVEVIERLLGVAERVADREARASFNRAFAAFSADCPPIPKNRTAEIVPQNGQTWSYDYAPLETIQKYAYPVLHKHGLSCRFSNEDREEGDLRYTRVICTVSHVDGHSESSSVTLRKGAGNRRISDSLQDGGTLTTAQRKALTLALGLLIEPEDIPEPTIDYINEEQVETIRDMVQAREFPHTKMRAFLDWAGADRIDHISSSRYDAVLDKLSSIPVPDAD